MLPSGANALANDQMEVAFVGGPLHGTHRNLTRGTKDYTQEGLPYAESPGDPRALL